MFSFRNKINVLFIMALCLLMTCCSNATKDNITPIAQSPVATKDDTISNKIPSSTPSATPPPKQVYSAKIAVVGDLMAHIEQVENAYNAEGNYDFNPCFADIKDYMQSHDFTIGNLETTFAGHDAGYSGYPTFNTPDEFGQALKDSGFDFLTTANNHSYDKREAGLLRTLDILDELGIDHVGTYRSQEERENVYIKEINNIQFAFLSYTYGINGFTTPEGKDYLVNRMDKELIASDIQKAKALNPDFIVVLPHMGNEYESEPRDIFKDWARFMLESGADIVLASHPHVLQPVEFVNITDDAGNERTCFIAYSLGNFISSQRTPPRDTGMVLTLHVEKEEEEKARIRSVSYMPTWVRFTNTQGYRDIKIFSIYNGLKAVENGEDVGLRPKDVSRIKAASDESAKTILGKYVPLDKIQEEYYIFP